MSDAWYFVDGDEQVGPVTHEQLRRFLLSRTGAENVFVWRKGFSDWKAVREVTELAAIFEAPPPLPRHAIRSASVPVTDIPATNPSQTAPPKESLAKKTLGIVASLFAWLIGYIAFRYYGTTFLWPAALIGGAWFILAKCKVEPVAVPMLAFVIGHTGWVIVGHAALAAMGSPIDSFSLLLDIAAVTALSIWFLWARSRAATIGILIYQIVALGSGVLQMGDITIPGTSTEAMMIGQAVHIILRIVGICLCIYAFVKLRKRAVATSRPDPLSV